MDRDPQTSGIRIEGDVAGSSLIIGDHNCVNIAYASGVVRPPKGSIKPYLGLQSFDEHSARFFFGREDFVAALLDRFVAAIARSIDEDVTRFHTILGPSGSGKSSIARGGLVPAIAQSKSPYLRNARIFILRPGLNPILSLADAMSRSPGTSNADNRQFESMCASFEVAAAGGASTLADAIEDAAGSKAPLVLIVDQWEELYSLEADQATAPTRRKRRGLFVDALLEASGRRNGSLSTVITFRSDFFGATAEHLGLNTTITRNHLLVPALSREGIRRAIVGPLIELQRERDDGAPPLIDEATIARILEQAQEHGAALPLVEFALSVIWDGLSQGEAAGDTLTRINGIGGALTHRADELYAALDAKDGDLVRRIFVGAVQVADLPAYDTRRRLDLAELVTTDISVERLRQAIEPFVRARLVASGSTDGEGVWVELTHEALIRSWPRLSTWTAAQREDLRFAQGIQSIVRQWDRAGRPSGSLWREPDLSLLKRHAARMGATFPMLQAEFLRRSLERDRRDRQTRSFVIGAILLLLIGSLAASLVAFRQSWQARAEKAQADYMLAQSLVGGGRPAQGLAVIAPYLDDSGSPIPFSLAGPLMDALASDHLLASLDLDDVETMEWRGNDVLAIHQGSRLLLLDRRLHLVGTETALPQPQSAAEPDDNRPWIEQVTLRSPNASKMIVYADGLMLEDASGKVITELPDSLHAGDLPEPNFFRFSPDSKLLFLAHENGVSATVSPEVVATGTGKRSFLLEDTHIKVSAFSPDSSRLATYNGKTVRIWTMAKNIFSTYGAAGFTAEQKGDGTTETNVNNTVYLRSSRYPGTAHLFSKFADTDEPTVTSSDDGRFVLASGEPGGMVELFSMETGERLSAISGLSRIDSVQFAGDDALAGIRAGARLWVSSTKRGAHWQLASNAERHRLDDEQQARTGADEAWTAKVLSQDRNALTFFDDVTGTGLAVEKSGAVLAENRSGDRIAFGNIAPGEVRGLLTKEEGLGAELDGVGTSHVAVLPDRSAMICGDLGCVIADAKTRRSTYLPDSACSQPTAVVDRGIFLCGNGNTSNRLNFFVRKAGRWASVNLLPPDVSARYEGPYSAVFPTTMTCPQRLLNYATDHADYGYSGSELWDLGSMRPLRVFDDAMTLGRRIDGGIAATNIPIGNASGMTLAMDVVPIICSNAEGRRLVAEAVRRAGLHLSSQQSFSQRLKDWRGLAAFRAEGFSRQR